VTSTLGALLLMGLIVIASFIFRYDYLEVNNRLLRIDRWTNTVNIFFPRDSEWRDFLR